MGSGPQGGRAVTYLKIAAAALAVLLAFTGGYRYAAALYEKDAAELREAEAVARADMGRKQYAKMVEALDALAGLRGELADARADADRMRDAFDRRLRRAEALAQEPDSADLARCTELLRESTELLSEGRELAIRSAAKADAVSALQK